MQNKKNAKSSWMFLSLLALIFPLFITNAKVEVGENFSSAYTAFVKNLPENVSFSSQAEEVYPYYLNPISNFNLSLLRLSKQNYKKGESIDISGSLQFSFEGKKILAKLEQDCLAKINKPEACKIQESYSIPEISGVGVFAQVWRVDENDQTAQKGDYLVDEFYITKDLTLKDGQGGTFNYKWKVPEEIKDGRYYISYYINANQSFDLNGSPLVTFNSAESQNFYVEKVDQSKSGVEIDKNSLKVNGKEYVYRNLAPTVNMHQDVIVEANIFNYDQSESQVKVKYSLYKWGQEDPKDEVSEKEEKLSLPGNSDTPIKFSFTPQDSNSLYNLKISLESSKSSSVSNVRMVMDGGHRGIFRYLGFLEKNNGNYVPIFCIRDAQWSGGVKGKVNLSVTDSRGQNLLGWSGEGQIKAGNDICFVPKDKEVLQNSGCIKVKGVITDDKNSLNDQKEVTFGCEVDNVSNFKYKKSGSSSTNPSQKIGQAGINLGLIALFILIFASIILIIFIINKKKNDKKNN